MRLVQQGLICAATLLIAQMATAGDEPAVSARAAKVHAAGLLFDGPNDLPWRLRTAGDVSFSKVDIGKRLKDGQTDIPRLREGGVKAQFWSVFVPHRMPNQARNVTEQISLVHRKVARCP